MTIIDTINTLQIICLILLGCIIFMIGWMFGAIFTKKYPVWSNTVIFWPFEKTPNLIKTYWAIYWRDTSIERILAYCGDDQFTIRIDLMCSGEVRYLCWHKSNSILAKPNLILRQGSITENEDGAGAEYVFHYRGCIYTVEHLRSDDGRSDLFFVEVTDTEQKKSTWKMEQMSIPKYLL